MCLMIFSKTGETVSKLVMQFAMIALFVFDAAASTPVETELHAEQWELSRNGGRLLAIEGLATVVTEWSSDDSQQIELQYPGGEEGEIWVSQLMDWLVALGVPSANLVAVPGSGQGDVIRLRVIRSGEKFR
jgi:hypothetical protein